MRDLYIIPECFVDTSLVESLLVTEGVNHQKGCFTVAGVMDSKLGDDFAVGVIDYDKHRPEYLDQFVELASSEHLQLMKHRSRSHYVIYVKPAMDGFILSQASEAGIKVEDYGFPADLKAFTHVTKSVTTKTDPRFKLLFHDLRCCREMQILNSVLNHLKAHRYKADDTQLKAYFK